MQWAKKIIFLSFFGVFLGLFQSRSQEFNANVKVETILLNTSNKQRFQLLEDEIKQLLGNTVWTDNSYGVKEKIDIDVFIKLKSIDGDKITGDFQVISKRPIYNTSYYSVLLNQYEQDIIFTYSDHDRVEYQEGTYSNEISSIICFYALMVLGLDADSFSLMGGSPYYKIAEDIAQFSAVSGEKRWQATSKFSRFNFVSAFNNEAFKPVRDFIYTYYRKGLDRILVSENQALENVLEKVLDMEAPFDANRGANIFPWIMRSKGEEITKMFLKFDIKENIKLQRVLMKIDPNNIRYYQSLTQNY